MALEDTNLVDAAGIERETGFVVLSLTDAWDWADEQEHLKALQAKFNVYLGFVESGEILETFPEAAFKPIVFNWVCKQPLPAIGEDFLSHVSDVCKKVGIQVRHVTFPG